MAILNQKRILNLIPKTSAPVTIHVSQGDVGTEIQFTLVKGDELFVNPGNVSASVHGVREDGANFGAFTCTLSGSTVSFPLHSEMTAVKGSALAEIVIVDNDGNKVGSANFAILVEESVFPLGVTYDNDVSVYESILAYVQTIPAQLQSNISDVNSALNNEIATRTSENALINTRINEIIAPTGEAPNPAEIVDARVTVLNKTKSTLGEAIRSQITDSKGYLDNDVKDISNVLNAIFPVDNSVQVPVSWKQGKHLYGSSEQDKARVDCWTSDFMLTSLVHRVILYNTDIYRGYIYYYDTPKEYEPSITPDVYIGSNTQISILKTRGKYCKLWIYDRNSNEMTESSLQNNVRIEDFYDNKLYAMINSYGIDNNLKKNGVWQSNLGLIVGGILAGSTYIGNKIAVNGALARARNTVPLIVKHDNAILRSGRLNSFPIYAIKCDDDNKVISFTDEAYSRTKILGKGRYYLIVKKANETSITASDLETISSLVESYYYFDDEAVSIDYSKLFCGNWYVEQNGTVSLGDSSWNTADNSITAVVIPAFYTDHPIYIRNKNSLYHWRDSVSDENNNVIYSTGYVNDDSLVEIPAGYHHIMVGRYTTSEIDLDAMAEALEIYATKIEAMSIKGIRDNVVERNMDIQNAIFATRKSSMNGNAYDKTVFVAHATDTHSDIVRWKHFLSAVNYYKPDLCVHTGDIVKYTMLDNYEYLTDDLPDSVCLLTMGNHETGVNHKIGEGGATNAELFSTFITPLNTKYNIGAQHLYYYYDVKGIRFICINPYDYDATTDATSFVDRSHIYYSQDQITWLINVLQDACNNSIPVVIFAHESDVYLPPSAGGEIPFNQTYEIDTFYSKTWTGNPICDLIEAFINGASLNNTYTETGSGIVVTINTSFANHGNFVTWLVGHRHSDHMGFLPGYSQFCICSCATACSIDSKNSTGGYSDLPRYEGERAEDAFNFYAINPTLKTIGIVRFGSNINFNLRERKYDVVSYVRST